MLSVTYLNGETPEECVTRYIDKHLAAKMDRNMALEQYREFTALGQTEHTAVWNTLFIWGILDDSEAIIATWNSLFGGNNGYSQ